jgi:NADH-quinone oxidoreductase subunit C
MKMTRLERLAEAVERLLGDRAQAVILDRGELTIEANEADYLSIALSLRDQEDLGFEQLIDLSGVDYLGYGGRTDRECRFAAVSQLLSVRNNWRLRLRVFAENVFFPVLPSLTEIWPSANWYERETFDLFGIMFEGHPDLRRILTDYGFVGHPFRKDFPVSGFMEMRYDPDQGRVIYQPVTIEPRENTPRVIREENFGSEHG